MTSRMAGSRKASVLPEPVAATPMRLRPEKAMGQPCDWMGVGLLKPLRSIASEMKDGKSACPKLMMGLGASSWLTVMLSASRNCSNGCNSIPIRQKR